MNLEENSAAPLLHEATRVHFHRAKVERDLVVEFVIRHSARIDAEPADELADSQSADELRGATDGHGSPAFRTLDCHLLGKRGFVATHLWHLHRIDDVDVPLLGTHAGFD